MPLSVTISLNVPWSDALGGRAVVADDEVDERVVEDVAAPRARRCSRPMWWSVCSRKPA